MESWNYESWVEKLDKQSKIESADSDASEISPDGRYLRYNEILGRGACKNVYKGFDGIDGIEVAWNQVNLEDALQSPEHLERLYSEVHLLRTLKHENVIRSYASWVDDKNKTINIITELFTSGSLRQYRRKHKSVDIKAIKNWARQILQGLHYLHTHKPPIIHRDLKCDNILVNGNHGEVKIGDLGLATIMQQPTARSVIGTPEFMAPELYEEEYNELVDIYSFGMCMLELVTCEYPYSECKNQAQIYRKVTSGIKPAALGKIEDSDVRSFIEKCLVPASQRSSAAELLKVHFLSSDNTSDYSCYPLQLSHSVANSVNSVKSDSPLMDLDPCKKLSSSTCESMIIASMSSAELHRCNERYEFSLKGEKYDETSVSLSLRIADYSGGVRNVHFMFFLNADTASSIAAEMVETLDLWKVDVDLIAELINNLIIQLVPHWGSSSGSLNGQRSLDEATSLYNEKFVSSGVRDCCSYDSRGKEANERGIHSEFTGLTNNGVRVCVCASSQKDLPRADYADEKHRRNINEQSMMSESVKSSGSWITASSDMDLSISSLSLTDKENELCDDLKAELAEINMRYQQRCRDLVKMREAAVENAKKKWIAKKMYVS